MPEPLSSQLSRALVAFTIEADDTFEHRVPHRTTRHGSTAAPGEKAPWLVSLLMWSMCVRFIPEEGVSIRDFAASAWWLTPKGISTTLRRMGGWWGYLTVSPRPDAAATSRTAAASSTDASPTATSRPTTRATQGERMIRLTAGGRKAREAWEPLVAEIEQRWCDRFGDAEVAALRSALADLAGRFERPLPDCLRLFDVDLERRAPARPQVADSLPGLLSQAILAFELEYETELEHGAGQRMPIDKRVPLAISANALAVLAGGDTAVKDLSVRTGLKDGVEGSVKYLVAHKLATVGPAPGGRRLRVASLTSAGAARHLEALEAQAEVEGRWQDAFGEKCVGAVSDALAPIVGDPDDADGPLWGGLYRYPEGWRTSLPRPATLPRHPMPAHSGGYLDGA